MKLTDSTNEPTPVPEITLYVNIPYIETNVEERIQNSPYKLLADKLNKNTISDVVWVNHRGHDLEIQIVHAETLMNVLEKYLDIKVRRAFGTIFAYVNNMWCLASLDSRTDHPDRFYMAIPKASVFEHLMIARNHRKTSGHNLLLPTVSWGLGHPQRRYRNYRR